MKKEEIEKMLTLARWAKHTLDDQLKFGLDEAQAVYARERRVKGVLLTLIKSFESALEEDGGQNEQ